MARRIRKYVDRAFSRTVDLDLLRRLLEPHQNRIGFDWDGPPYESENELRDAVFELFSAADGRFPASLQFALFNISTLSTDAGVNVLLGIADEHGVVLAPPEEAEGASDGRRLNPRHLALLAWLDHRVVFDRALDVAAFMAHSSKYELAGRDEGVSIRDGAKAQEAFKEAVSAYFAKRYQGRYCDLRWYNEDGLARALVLHGSKASTKNVDQDGEEDSLTFREIVQDTIEYDAERGMIAIGAHAMPDARKLAVLFAEHLLGDADFFGGADADNLYTLERINQLGVKFRCNHDWDPEVVHVRIREVQVDEGGGRRHSPWALTVRDADNALRRLAELWDGIDFADLRINHVKLEFVLKHGGVENMIAVKVKPPGLASYRDHSHESVILEHLERYGIRRARPLLQLRAAAE